MNTELTDNERRTLLELINNPSTPYDTLVVNLGISRRMVSRAFTSLEEKGFIERIRTNKKGIGKSSNKRSFVRFLKPPPIMIWHEPAVGVYNINWFLFLALDRHPV